MEPRERCDDVILFTIKCASINVNHVAMSSLLCWKNYSIDGYPLNENHLLFDRLKDREV
jgi:hypothetical protein